MKQFITATFLLALSTGLAQLFLPWWMVVVCSIIVSLIFAIAPAKAFLSGFTAIFVLWLTFALFRDFNNGHILSTRMAQLFHLPNYFLFLLVSAFAGGLMAGCTCCSVSFIKIVFNKK
jgi:hypothetical protein